MNPVAPSGKKSPSWFNADNLFTGVTVALMLVILAVFLLYPVVDICRLSFFKDGVFTLENYTDYFSEPRIFRSFYNSMFVSIVTMVITTVLAFLFGNGITNLLRREADIALRMVRPAQSTLVARKLAELPLVKAGDELGFIRFGSRVDHIIPVGSTIKVKPGEKVTGCKSIIAELN